jgi:cytoskeletal protein CcmA (bactofilin family)
MDNKNETPKSKENDSAYPAPEVLAPRKEDGTVDESAKTGPAQAAKPAPRRHRTYRPSHKATFVSLTVVVFLLAINAGVVAFVLMRGSGAKGLNAQNDVTISQASLDKIGVNRSSIGDSGLELVVGPDARFNGEVTVAGSVSISKELKLNSKFSAADASLTQLEAGNTALSQLNVNGDSTLSNLNLRGNLQVAGSTRLQGPVTLAQLLTVNNSVNVVGNLSVGGALSTGNLSVRSLTVASNLVIGGHVITSGQAPGVSVGSGVGNNGTVSISGNDAAGTVAVNVGTGSTGGNLANVTFRSHYGNIPHVVVTPVGGNVGSFYISRNSTGFSIYIGAGVSPGGYAFDYIVEQ